MVPHQPFCFVTVSTLDGVEELLAVHSFSVWRRTPTMVVLDPATTGGVQIALVESFLPGDSRN